MKILSRLLMICLLFSVTGVIRAQEAQTTPAAVEATAEATAEATEEDDEDTSTVDKVALLESKAGIKWNKGPGNGMIGNIAQVKIPAGYVFAGADDTQKLMTFMENTVSGDELGVLAPASMDWFLIYEYDDVGYVKDDEKDKLKAGDILASIQRGTEAGNKERKKRGWSTIEILGWQQEPAYNEQTNNLEWAVKARSEDHLIVNYNTRILGRTGVMRATLVCDPGDLEDIMPDFKTAMAGFEFQAGRKYAEYRQGDKIAEYGLSALVVGGAAAVAVKSGAAKGLWKLIVLVIAGIGGLFGKIFGRKSD